MNGGVTGHRQFDDHDTEAWVRHVLATAVRASHICHGFTCLAEGSDQLFAEVLMALSVPFTVIVPCRDYESSFTDNHAVERFHTICEASYETRQLDFAAPSDAAFLAASQNLVESIGVLFAVWDGKASRGLGGTADVVKYAVQLGKRIVHINPMDRTVSGCVE